MRDYWKALLMTCTFVATQAYASEASDALLNADRAMAAQSRAIGFGPALSKMVGADARKFDGGSPPAIGRESILAVLAKYSADLQLDWTPEEAVVAKSGELGYTWGRYVAKSHNSKGDLTTNYGVYMDVWRRDDDGTWRWIADMGVSTPAPGDKANDAKAASAPPTTSINKSTQ
jgi:ketosteroid isomerase-like protein